MFVSSKEAAKRLGLHPNTLRAYADDGKIEHYRTESGQRRYNVESYLGNASTASVVCYCRVSSSKQRDDLERQAQFMREHYPEAEIIKDIGSGLNYKRKGLKTILERAVRGDKLKVVVAHRDRLCRFGFELIEHIIKLAGGEIVVLKESSLSPEQELTTDLLSIIHVFSFRLHGLRNYKSKIREAVSDDRSEKDTQKVV